MILAFLLPRSVTEQIKINLPKLPPTFLFRRWLLLCHGLSVLRFHLGVKRPDTVLVVQDLFGTLVLRHQQGRGIHREVFVILRCQPEHLEPGNVVSPLQPLERPWCKLANRWYLQANDFLLWPRCLD